MPRAVLAVPLVLAALLSACAGNPSSASEFEGEEKRVADVVERLQDAGETDDAQTICDELLAKQLREQIQEAGSDCEQELEKAIEDSDDFDLDVQDVTIDGNSATARVEGSEGVRSLELVREGRDWRATSLGS